MKRIFFVILPQMHILDLGGPMQIFASLTELDIADIKIQCVGPESHIQSYQGLCLNAIAPLPKRLIEGDVIVVVGSKIQAELPATSAQQKVTRWLSEIGGRLPPGVLIASVCTGAIQLAQAGLLDGRLCTTHHNHLKMLQQLAPQARVINKRILVQDGPIYTSAGVSAGIDLALHLITQYFGSAISARIARENLIQFRRLEADPQLSVHLSYRNHQHPLIHAVQDWLAQQTTVQTPLKESLSAQFSVSYRHLSRLFMKECGISLKQYQQIMRLDRSRQLFMDTDWSIERITEHCGFASLQSFRAAWRQHETLPPSKWREKQRQHCPDPR
ncbi:helix-turn-helix domain-containing protein [Alcaligenes aquatilis]|jgi:transcriptional regulator GlxA family with amidase domain|uniref:GlxA family transcriptional regulator n=1 Tax=Alcaligenes aquatilis TaxID=323284 RepID=UPI002AA817D3|nr:helix-turn-helix domain-containing protein [Alcaligenes faecalis]